MAQLRVRKLVLVDRLVVDSDSDVLEIGKTLGRIAEIENFLNGSWEASAETDLEGERDE